MPTPGGTPLIFSMPAMNSVHLWNIPSAGNGRCHRAKSGAFKLPLNALRGYSGIEVVAFSQPVAFEPV